MSRPSPTPWPMPWPLVVAAAIGMFAATSTGSTRAPFLTDMATDLNVSLPAIANLFGVTATTWGISSYLVGYASDRIGRRVFLLASPALLALTMIAAALAGSYGMLIVFIVLAAICCGAFTSSAMAEVSLRTKSTHQGRALGYVMSGQSLTLLIGVPVSAWIGAKIGWRGTHFALAGLSVFAVVCMLLALYWAAINTQPSSQVSKSKNATTIKQAMTGPVVRLFIALGIERLCFGLAAFYYASYLRTAYDLPVQAVAIPLAIFAVGNIAGTLLGGQLADRFAYRRISFSVPLVIAGFIALPWFGWRSGMQVTVIFGFLFAFFNALGRPSLLAAMADVPEDVRGVIMGLNSSIASIGWLCAALVGGWLYAFIGFSAFGLVMASASILAAMVVIPDSRLQAKLGSN